MNIMSSWANIKIPRKRDISKIPEEFRPTLLTRAERPEVVRSEAFQYTVENDNFNSIINTFSTKQIKERTNEYVGKKIESKPSPGAFELKYNNNSYVFVILRHIRQPKDNDLWISSYNSIRKYYTNKIIIIDDNSMINTVNGKLYETEIIQSEFAGAGEVLPFYYFLQQKWADVMIFLHDSMFINRPFKDDELDQDVKYHWYFKTNGLDDQRKIKNYLQLLSHHKDLVDFYTDPNSSWRGVYGATLIIPYNIVSYLEEKYNIFTTLAMTIKSRKDRETFERVLGILLCYEGSVNGENCSNFGDILKYPDAFDSENNNVDTASHIVTQRGYNTAILKVWRGR